MSMVSRYQKKGGFLQLLQVIETCNQKKQEHFLKLIHEENPEWSKALTEKVLTFEKILAWPIENLIDVLEATKIMPFAVALSGFDKDKQSEILNRFSHSDKKRIENVLLEVKANPNEIQTTILKVVADTRQLIIQGVIRLEKVDASLVVPDNIEQQLNQKKSELSVASDLDTSEDHLPLATTKGNVTAPSGGVGVDAKATLNSDVIAQEYEKIKLKVIQIKKENENLKLENRFLKDKLEQIKKIA